MKSVHVILLATLSGGVASSHAQTDPLAVYLTSKGFSNVPYTDQVRVAPGGYVAYDTQHSRFPPVWEGPVEGESPLILPASDEIHVPSETLNRLRTLKLDVKVFGIDPMAMLQSGSSLTYSEMILKPSALKDANAMYKLLTPGSALEKEFLEYGGNGSRVYANQHLYGILTVYYSTGVTITSTKSIGVGASSTTKLDACPTSITPAADPTKDKDKPATPGNPTPTTKPTTGGAKGIGEAAAKAGLIAAGQAAGGEAGQAVSGSGGAAAAKSTGSQVAAAAVKAASGSLPGGGGTYCRVDETHVEFHSAQPIPIAAQLLRAFPSGDSWNLLPAIVQFDGSRTREISHN